MPWTMMFYPCELCCMYLYLFVYCVYLCVIIKEIFPPIETHLKWQPPSSHLTHFQVAFLRWTFGSAWRHLRIGSFWLWVFGVQHLGRPKHLMVTKPQQGTCLGMVGWPLPLSCRFSRLLGMFMLPGFWLRQRSSSYRSKSPLTDLIVTKQRWW